MALVYSADQHHPHQREARQAPYHPFHSPSSFRACKACPHYTGTLHLRQYPDRLLKRTMVGELDRI